MTYVRKKRDACGEKSQDLSVSSAYNGCNGAHYCSSTETEQVSEYKRSYLSHGHAPEVCTHSLAANFVVHIATAHTLDESAYTGIAHAFGTVPSGSSAW